jgi:predicted small secreted protein
VLSYLRMLTRRLASAIVVLVLLTGCNTMRQVAGLPVQSEPSVDLKSAETRWLLIKNPRFGDVPSEPEYIWVEDDRVPTTLTTLIRGTGSIIAPPEIVARYGPPPGGGKISPRQGVPYAAAPSAPQAQSNRAAAAATGGRAAGTPAPARSEAAKRGFVVYVDTTRIVVDLNANDGLRVGAVISLRRDRIPIVHPVTGEVLGELDEEVGTARITELRDKFSVAEIQTVAPGSQVQIKDRVVQK